MSQLSVVLQQYSRGWRGDIAALIAGAAAALAFAPIDWWWMAIIGVAVLFNLWIFSSVRQAFVRGGLFGLGFFGVGISWVFISIHYHGFVGFWLSLFLTFLLVLVMALFPALLGYLVNRYFSNVFEVWRSRLILLLVLPAAWMLAEWVRGWFMTGFPWLALGYSQVDAPLSGWAPVVGTYGVSWLIALTGASLVGTLLDKGGRWFYLSGVAIIWLMALPLQESYWGESFNAPIKVALLQGNIPQDIKWHPEVRKPTIELYTELTRQNWDADLIIWPETALPAFYYEVESFLDDLEIEAKQNETDMLVGLLSYSEDRRNYFNTMLSLGESRERYHKNHLVPFTEYLPLKWLLGNLVRFMQVPMSDFAKGGSEQSPLHVARNLAGISICFEDAFGEEVIRTLPEATFLVNVSNDAWFDDSWAPQQHLQMARMRAIEAERPLLRATNTGMTAIIGEKGELLKVAPQFEVAAVTGVIQPRSGMTPYAYTGNWLVVSLAIGMLVLAWRTMRIPVVE